MLITCSLDENIKPDQIPPRLTQRMVAGSPAQIADQLKTKVIDVGIDGVIINMPRLHARCHHRRRRGAAPVTRAVTGLKRASGMTRITFRRPGTRSRCG